MRAGTKSKGTIGIVVRVSDVRGRDKRGDRFISPEEQVRRARGYVKLPSEYLSLMHEAQREEIGLRWADAKRNARERGVLPQREAYGYTRTADGRVRLAPKQAERVREAFRLRAAGESFSA